MFNRVLAYFPLSFRLPGGFFPFRDPIREALFFCEPLFSMSILGFGLWAPSGPFPLSGHYGLYKRGMDTPKNPSHHLKKEKSALPLKSLLKEGRGRSPTAAAATTNATPCPGHEDTDEAFLCVVKTQQSRSKKIYKTEITKIRYKIK